VETSSNLCAGTQGFGEDPHIVVPVLVLADDGCPNFPFFWEEDDAQKQTEASQAQSRDVVVRLPAEFDYIAALFGH